MFTTSSDAFLASNNPLIFWFLYAQKNMREITIVMIMPGKILLKIFIMFILPQDSIGPMPIIKIAGIIIGIVVELK